MKKTNYFVKAITVILIFCALLSSCNIPNDSDVITTEKSTIGIVSTEPVNTSEMSTELITEITTDTMALIGDQSENENYKLLTQRDIKEYKYVGFLVKSSKKILNLKVPYDWNFKSIDNNSYTITRDDKTIGKIALDAVNDSDSWQNVFKQETNANGFNMTENIDKSGTLTELKFRYRYVATSEESVVTLTVDYTELNSIATSILLRQNTFSSRDYTLGLNKVTPKGNGDILIIGNSFINTSDIGDILAEMLKRNKKTLGVKAISRGMATVETYIGDTTLMNEIKQGKYSVVFACGLYSYEEINNLEQLKKICKRSKTPLVIFPAHNENESVIKKATRQISDLYFLDWKCEIDTLINDGRNRWDFCIDDYYYHSTAIAGYVGAQMIYRSIFGDIPKAKLGTSISYQTVNTVLGDYVKTGYAKGTLYNLG